MSAKIRSDAGRLAADHFDVVGVRRSRRRRCYFQQTIIQREPELEPGQRRESSPPATAAAAAAAAAALDGDGHSRPIAFRQQKHTAHQFRGRFIFSLAFFFLFFFLLFISVLESIQMEQQPSTLIMWNGYFFVV